MSELNATIEKLMVINPGAAKSRVLGNPKQLTGTVRADGAQYWAKQVLWALVIATSVWDLAVTFGGVGSR